MTMIISAAASNAGRVREKNEDNFFLNGKTLSRDLPETDAITDESCGTGLYAVCDGMGGGAHGEIASAIAVDALHKVVGQMSGNGMQTDELIDWYTHEANSRICAEMEKRRGRRIGTTFVVASIREGVVKVYNLGDSRAYLLWGEGSKLTQLSHDHTKVGSLVEMGFITKEKARSHPERHTLTQHLGIYPEELVIEPHIAPAFSLVDGDILLLCSDGLTDMLEDPEIALIMRGGAEPGEIADNLVAAALQNGGKDNVTVVVVKKRKV